MKRMSTLLEIETAAGRLGPEERRKLLLWLAESLRSEGQQLPSPRAFSIEQMRGWIEEDERDGKALREEK
jgi:hypothetical protein